MAAYLEAEDCAEAYLKFKQAKADPVLEAEVWKLDVELRYAAPSCPAP